MKHVGELGKPDMVILPGTKNTMEDLLWMRQNGLEAAILKLAKKDTVIFGVCGGYQMLGEILSDPEGVEAGGEIRGMGLLPMDTVFAGDKTRTRMTGTFGGVTGILSGLSGVQIEGYEIHMGVTKIKEGAEHLTNLGEEKKADGAYKGNVYGTYLHGIFDKEQVVKEIVTSLGNAKGIDMERAAAFNMAEFKESQYEILAMELRKHLDMKKIYEILETGIDK